MRVPMRESDERLMPRLSIELRALHREEPDGSHTLTLTVGGLPSLAKSHETLTWLRNAILANAKKIGTPDE